jgi:hypothetical protein
MSPSHPTPKAALKLQVVHHRSSRSPQRGQTRADTSDTFSSGATHHISGIPQPSICLPARIHRQVRNTEGTAAARLDNRRYPVKRNTARKVPTSARVITTESPWYAKTTRRWFSGLFAPAPPSNVTVTAPLVVTLMPAPGLRRLRLDIPEARRRAIWATATTLRGPSQRLFCMAAAGRTGAVADEPHLTTAFRQEALSHQKTLVAVRPCAAASASGSLRSAQKFFRARHVATRFPSVY